MPLVAVARYGAVGSLARQRHVVVAPLFVHAHEQAVGHRRPPLRHRDLVVVGRLVLRRVVDRVPARRALRLVDDERAVVGRDPAVLGLVRIDDRVRMAVVVDGDDEGPPAPDPGRGRDDQLLAVAPERRPRAVDRHAADVQPAQVEIEAREVLGRAGGDHRARRERVVARLEVEPQGVVADVVAAVAGEREERIAGARGARRERGRACGGSAHQQGGDGAQD